MIHKRALDPTDPYLLEVVRSAERFERERAKRLKGLPADLEETERHLRHCILKAASAWQRDREQRRHRQ